MQLGRVMPERRLHARKVISVDRNSRGEIEVGRAAELNAEGVRINAYDIAFGTWASVRVARLNELADARDATRGLRVSCPDLISGVLFRLWAEHR